MAYYIRVLSPGRIAVSPKALSTSLQPLGCELLGDLDFLQWKRLEVARISGVAICVVERSALDEDGLTGEELSEFREEVAECLPRSAAAWLSDYFDRVQTIYAIQVLPAAYENGGWDVVGQVHQSIWNSAGGILQADGEGFSNEDGFHILWQFSEDVTGPWAMAVLKDDRWHPFQMDLGNPQQRDAFRQGEIPSGVERQV